MKFTLRKASVLQNEIQEAAKNITLVGRVALNEFQEAKTALATANTDLKANLGRLSKLNGALANVRALVGQANLTSGVNGKLADLAAIDKMISRYTELAVDTNLSDDIAVIDGKLNKLKTRDEARYYGAETVDTGVLSAADMEAFREELRVLRKRKQTINDEILELNIRTEIELSEEVVAVLKAEKVI